VRGSNVARHVPNDGSESSGTYDRIGTGVCCPFVERVNTVVSWNVLLDELLVNRLGMHPLAKPSGGNRMERDVFGRPY
jgi:hypothetical protein